VPVGGLDSPGVSVVTDTVGAGGSGRRRGFRSPEFRRSCIFRLRKGRLSLRWSWVLLCSAW